MVEQKHIGWRPSDKELDLVEAIRVKTDEKTASDVMRKALLNYARSVGVPA